MGYPRTKPYTEPQMFADNHPGHHTICQTNRDLYNLLNSLDIPAEAKQEAKDKVLLIFAFGKRMHNKLKEYRKRYEDEEKNRTYEEEI